jgi:aspartate/methionine/tyrosine aminotransferase
VLAFAPVRPAANSNRSRGRDFIGEVGVTLVAGTSFGDQGEGYIRFSYANSIANIEEATDRIARALVRRAKR